MKNDQMFPEACIEFNEAREGPMPDPEVKPALEDLNRAFNNCFVLRCPHARRNYSHVVMSGKPGIGWIDYRIVAMGFGHRTFEIIRRQELGGAAKPFKHPDMRGQKIG